MFTTFLILFMAMLTRYFLLAGILNLVCLKTKKEPIAKGSKIPGQDVADIKWSVLSTVVFAVFGTILVSLWESGETKIYQDISEYGLFYLIVSFPLFLILQDTYFYWTHRILHKKSLMRFHKAHHHSKSPSAWTSFAFHPVEAFIQASLLPVLVYFLPVHWSVFLGLLVFMTAFGLLNHLGFEFFPRFLETKLGLITATHHQHHHENQRKNFGLYFNWWDRLLNTEGVRSV